MVYETRGISNGLFTSDKYRIIYVDGEKDERGVGIILDKDIEKY